MAPSTAWQPALHAALLAAVVVSPAFAAAAAPVVRANALVRIDPKTNAITDVIGVGSSPMAVAVSGRSVWVYNDLDRTVSEIDAANRRVLRSTFVPARPVDLGHLAGPVLAADAGGAWLVGIDDQLGPLLTRIPAGGGDTRAYMLDVEPRAVAVGVGAVWVAGHRPGDNELLRVNKATGAVTGRTWFPDAGRVDSLDVGKGAAWVMFARTGALYRVDTRTMELGDHVDLGRQAGRPRVTGRVVSADREGNDTVDGFGSSWTTERELGTTVRRYGRSRRETTTISITGRPRSGLCETAVAAGAGAVWVAVGPASTCAARDRAALDKGVSRR